MIDYDYDYTLINTHIGCYAIIWQHCTLSDDDDLDEKL